jgi:alpha-beta hydrolase superfamily lysophospholipase
MFYPNMTRLRFFIFITRKIGLKRTNTILVLRLAELVLNQALVRDPAPASQYINDADPAPQHCTKIWVWTKKITMTFDWMSRRILQ